MAKEAEMRLNSLESADREEKVSRRMQDVSTSGTDTASGLDGFSVLPATMSSPAGFFSKTRTRLKKRIRIFSMNSNRVFKRGMDVCGSLGVGARLQCMFFVVKNLDIKTKVLYDASFNRIDRTVAHSCEVL